MEEGKTNMVDYVDMGKRIKYKRKQHRMNQETLAKAVNISPSYFGNIERGNRIPSIDTLVALANVLGVGTDFLLASSLDVIRSRMSPDEKKRISRYLRDRVEELIYDDAFLEDGEEEADGIVYNDSEE